MNEEARLYEPSLREAKEHLARWEQLGTRLNKTLDPGWRLVLAQLQGGVTVLELLIQIAKDRS
jgi:hypothetical protein